MMITKHPDGSFSLGNEQGDFVDGNELEPTQRTIGSISNAHTYELEMLSRTDIDATPYRELLHTLLETYTIGQISTIGGIHQDTLKLIASGKQKSVHGKTALKFDKLKKQFGVER